jgi:hypothetical protein
MSYDEIINWLLEGDVSIQYQVHRDLLSKNRPDLQARIAREGWGAALLACRQPNGHWGRGFYQVKWISSHYSLLDLKNLCIAPRIPEILETLDLIVTHETAKDGGINPSRSIEQSDVCVNGMFLNYASYFGMEESKLNSVVDFILSQRMADGGFNCRFNRPGARHSSLHSTLSVAEGIAEYEKNGYAYRLAELKKAEETSREFMLLHQLFLSDRTGEIINGKFLVPYYPSRWMYDIFRALDYCQQVGMPMDDRLIPAIKMVQHKRKKDGRWLLPAKHPGLTHFEMEKAGEPSRWNTLRCLRILKHFKQI